MIKFNKLWKSIKACNDKKYKRDIKQVNLQEIDISEYIIIDVRSKREYRENHLKDAINIPLPDVKQNIENFVTNKNKKILIYCQSGIRSAKAVEIMENMGYTQVYNLKGGLENI